MWVEIYSAQAAFDCIRCDGCKQWLQAAIRFDAHNWTRPKVASFVLSELGGHASSTSNRIICATCSGCANRQQRGLWARSAPESPWVVTAGPDGTVVWQSWHEVSDFPAITATAPAESDPPATMLAIASPPMAVSEPSLRSLDDRLSSLEQTVATRLEALEGQLQALTLAVNALPRNRGW